MVDGIVTDESGLSTGFTYTLPEIIGEDEGIILPGPYVFSGGRESLGGIDITGSGLTLACRVRVDSASHTDARMISKAVGVQEADHWWMMSTHQDTRLRFRLKTNGVTTTLFSSLNTIIRGQWVHVAATYDGQKMRLYRDGVLVTEVAKTGVIDSNSTVNAALGNQPSGAGDAPLHGVMEDVQILDRAISAAEIADLAGVDPEPIPDPDPDPDPIPEPNGIPYKHVVTSNVAQTISVGVVGPVPTQVYTGPTTITKSGTVIENVVINSGLNIYASNVTLRNVIINCSGGYALDIRNPGAVIEYSRIVQNVGSKNMLMYSPGNVKIINNEIRGGDAFIFVSGNVDGMVVENNYMHTAVGTSDSHSEAFSFGEVTSLPTTGHVIIRGNYIDKNNPNIGSTDLLFCSNSSAQSMLIENNYWTPWGYYTLRFKSENTPLIIRNNIYSLGFINPTGNFGAYYQLGANNLEFICNRYENSNFLDPERGGNPNDNESVCPVFLN